MKVALLGYGTIGKDTAALIEACPALEVAQIYVRPGKENAAEKKTSDYEAILADPEIAAVAEAMGGLEPAYSMLKAALLHKKHVVTANKQLVSVHGPELARLAEEQGVAFLFNASCGGGLPYLTSIADARQSDRLEQVGGVLNGTTNFILNAVQLKGGDFDSALKEAQRRGFAELDPSDDIEGRDTARKCILACGVAFGRLPPEQEMAIEGIASLHPADVEFFHSRGLRCRLTARAGLAEGFLNVCVQPTLVTEDDPLYNLPGGSLVWYQGVGSGRVHMTARAAHNPTASAMVRDLTTAAQGRHFPMLPTDSRLVTPRADGMVCSYYLRVNGQLPQEPVWVWHPCDAGSWCETGPLPAADVHRMAQALRREGSEVFFAALPD